jgi:signal transduction histidine kinase
MILVFADIASDLLSFVSLSVGWSSFFTDGFLALPVLVLISVLYAIHRFRMGSFLAREKQLKAGLAEKTVEYESLVAGFENTTRELEACTEQLFQHNLLNEKLAMIVAHDLQSPLRFLLDRTRRLNSGVSEKEGFDLKGETDELIRATEQIFHFADEFGCWVGTMGKNFRVQPSVINLPDLLRALDAFFKEQLKEKTNEIVLPEQSSLCVYTDARLLKIILRNIIDNANKHSSHSRIEIGLVNNEGSVEISVTDQGRGMSERERESIRRRLSTPFVDSGEPERGYGYRFIADLSRLMDLRVDIETLVGKGTMVTVSGLPVANG